MSRASCTSGLKILEDDPRRATCLSPRGAVGSKVMTVLRALPHHLLGLPSTESLEAYFQRKESAARAGIRIPTGSRVEGGQRPGPGEPPTLRKPGLQAAIRWCRDSFA